MLQARGGFSLIEIVIAIGIAAFCLVAMLGLIPTGMKSVKTSIEQTTATEALDAIALDLRDIQPGSNITSLYGIGIPSGTGVALSTNLALSSIGTPMTSTNSLNTEFAVNVTLSNSTTFLTTAHIQIYWPPMAQLQNAQGIVETTITFNRN